MSNELPTLTEVKEAAERAAIRLRQGQRNSWGGDSRERYQEAINKLQGFEDRINRDAHKDEIAVFRAAIIGIQSEVFNRRRG